MPVPDTAPPTVLVVEDEPPLADLYAEWLADAYDVQVAYDGESALELLEGTSVVLLDRRMPGLSGDQVLEVIEERELPCYVALVTAVDPEFDIIDKRFDLYLTKPVSKLELRTAVERLIARRNYSDRLREYFEMGAKKSALEANKTRSELEASDEYASLCHRVETLRLELDDTLETMSDDDWEFLWRTVEDPVE